MMMMMMTTMMMMFYKALIPKHILNIFSGISKTPGVSLWQVFTRRRKSLKVFVRRKSMKVLSFPTDEAPDGLYDDDDGPSFGDCSDYDDDDDCESDGFWMHL